MAEPSDIRINPFTGTGGATNYVELTEKHIVPANSPYVIRLNEVPEKQDPSNIKMVYLDSATGAATSTTLTEVAATPGQGEFRMDYTTNAMEDKTWNTGLVEFSAADAGKIVQVTYTGTGTLAGVKSNHYPSWYTDRGDGSDGDFVPTENTTISGVKNYKSVFIKEGITVTVDKYALIKCQGMFANNGTINVLSINNGGKAGYSRNSGNIGGNGDISKGGAGGKSRLPDIKGGAGGYPIVESKLSSSGIANIDAFYGSGGGGGAGDTNGDSSYSGGAGGGGGGTIAIICNSFSNVLITAKGGNGIKGETGSTGAGGGGGGGLIVVISQTIKERGNFDVTGGNSGTVGYVGAKGYDGITFVKELGVI